MIATVPFSLKPLGFQVSGHYLQESSYSDSQHIIFHCAKFSDNKGVLKLECTGDLIID